MAATSHFTRDYSRRIKTAALSVGVVIAAGALSACTGGSTASTTDGSKSSAKADLTSQTWLVPQDWGAIDPTQEAATNSGAILLVLEPLVLADGHGGVHTNLATQTQPNPTTWVYTLRTGVKFTDGTPLTINDVLYSFQIHTAKNSKSNLAGDFSDVKTITAKNNALTITLTAPNVQFPNYVAQVGIVEKSARLKAGSHPGSPGHLNVGTGPYTVASYQPGNQVVLARNESYWGTKPAAKKITLRLIQDDSARLLAVQGGGITGAFEIPASEVNVYSKIPGMHVVRGPNPSVMMLNVNNTQKPWNEPAVRKAASMAIDKADIVKAILHGSGSPAASVVQPASMESLLGKADTDALYKKLNQNPFDVAAAKAELATSTVPHGFSGTLVYSQAEETSGLVAQAVASELKAIGINLTVKSMPDSQYTDAVFFKHTAGPAIVDFTTDIPDPVSLANYLSNSANSLAKGGYTDIAEFKNPAQDALLSQYLQVGADQKAKRAGLLSQILKNLADDQPYIPIYNSDYLAVVKNGVTFAGFDGMWWMRRWTGDVTSG